MLVFRLCIDRIVYCWIRLSRYTTDVWYFDADYSGINSGENIMSFVFCR